MRDVVRYMTVRDLLRQAEREGRRLSQEKACRRAAELLAGTAFGNVEPRQIGRESRKVLAAFHDGTARAKYFLFTDKRYLDADRDGFMSLSPAKLSGSRQANLIRFAGRADLSRSRRGERNALAKYPDGSEAA